MDCIFCKIVEGTIPSKKVLENEHVIAFHDIAPAAPVHLLVIPKKHIASMNDVAEGDWPLMGEVLKAARQVAEEAGIAEDGYRLINNCGTNGGQLVHHIHVHVVGGEKLGAMIGNK